MLSEVERRRIQALVAHNVHPRAALPEALKVVQEQRGWVSDESLAAVAAELELSVDDVEGIATAYNMIFRRPVGRHVILLCDSVSCWLTGEPAIYEALRDRLAIAFGESTPDGRFTLLPAACLGACDRAPALMIDDDLHGPLTPEGLDEILARYP
jgi:NADH-quinone oxidoreductase subunit E